MPCERCGSYRDECPCVEKQETLDAMRALAMRSESIMIATDARLFLYNEAARQRAGREWGY